MHGVIRRLISFSSDNLLITKAAARERRNHTILLVNRTPRRFVGVSMISRRRHTPRLCFLSQFELSFSRMSQILDGAAWLSGSLVHLSSP